MSDTVSISEDEYAELRLYKKLVENNLTDEVDYETIKEIETDRNSTLLHEKDAKKKYPDFFGE